MKLDRDSARSRFASARVARLATVDDTVGDGQPHAVPVTFAAEGDQVFMVVDAKPKSSRDLKRLRNIRAHPRVCLLADHYEEDWQALWWVRADGVAEIIEEEAARAAPVRLLARKYPQYRTDAPTGQVIAVAVERWVGWTAST